MFNNSFRILAGVGTWASIRYLGVSVSLEVVTRPKKPPYLVLRGCKIQSINYSLGWVEFSVSADVSSVVAWLLEAFQVTDFVHLEQGWKGYINQYQSPCGVWLACDHPSNMALVRVRFPQSFLETMSQHSLVALVEALGSSAVTVERLDSTFDDTTRITSLEEVTAAFSRDDVVSRSRSDPKLHSEVKRKNRVQMTGISIGSRVSETFLRIYDKTLETIAKRQKYVKQLETAHKKQKLSLEQLNLEKNAIAAEAAACGIRFEVEYKHGRADKVAKLLAVTPFASWSSVALGLLSSYVDFRDSTSNKHVSRRTVLPWWGRFCALACDAKLPTTKKPVLIEDFLQRVDTQLCATLALVARAVQTFGKSWLRTMIKNGRESFKSRHLLLVAAFDAFDAEIDAGFLLNGWGEMILSFDLPVNRALAWWSRRQFNAQQVQYHLEF